MEAVLWTLSLPTCVASSLTPPLSFLTCEVATIMSVISLVVTVWVVPSRTFIECLLTTVQSETVYLVQ